MVPYRCRLTQPCDTVRVAHKLSSPRASDNFILRCLTALVVRTSCPRVDGRPKRRVAATRAPRPADRVAPGDGALVRRSRRTCPMGLGHDGAAASRSCPTDTRRCRFGVSSKRLVGSCVNFKARACCYNSVHGTTDCSG